MQGRPSWSPRRWCCWRLTWPCWRWPASPSPAGCRSVCPGVQSPLSAARHAGLGPCCGWAGSPSPGWHGSGCLPGLPGSSNLGPASCSMPAPCVLLAHASVRCSSLQQRPGRCRGGPYPTEDRVPEGSFVEVLLAAVLLLACATTPCLRSLRRPGEGRPGRLWQVRKHARSRHSDSCSAPAA